MESQATRTVTIAAEWGNIGFSGRKRNGQLWEVTYYEDGVQVDTSYHHLNLDAIDRADAFLDGHINTADQYEALMAELAQFPKQTLNVIVTEGLKHV